MPAIGTLQQEAERFLYNEAWLLDEQRFHDWLDLLTDDIRYVMPTFESVQGRARPYEDEDVYLGYFVAGCASLEYKANFRPNQILHSDGFWHHYVGHGNKPEPAGS